MAKQSNVSKQLLAETRPDGLRNAALGAFLSFFVFLGALLVADAAAVQIAGEPGFVLGSILGAF
jgi:hypothetical protein